MKAYCDVLDLDGDWVALEHRDIRLVRWEKTHAALAQMASDTSDTKTKMLEAHAHAHGYGHSHCSDDSSTHRSFHYLHPGNRELFLHLCDQLQRERLADGVHVVNWSVLVWDDMVEADGDEGDDSGGGDDSRAVIRRSSTNNGSWRLVGGME